MGDFLTQEQIDALLNQQLSSSGFGFGGAEEPSAPDVGIAAADVDYSALVGAFSILTEQAGGVLSTLLSRTVNFSAEDAQSADSDSVRSIAGDPALVISLPISGGIDGTFYALLSTRNAAILSDLMMMGDGSAEFCDDHRDATGELFNQVMGAFTTALGDRIGTSVSAGSIDVRDFDAVKPPVPYAESTMVTIALHVDDVTDSTLALLVPADVAAAFMDALPHSSGGSSSMMGGLSSSELEDLSNVSGTDFGGFGGGDFGGGSMGPMGGGGFGGAFGGGGGGGGHSSSVPENVNMLLDIELDVAIELGRTDLSIKRILELAPGSIVELDRLAGEPVDLMVNNKVVAKGEVVVVDESFGIRIVSLVSPEERIKSLK